MLAKYNSPKDKIAYMEKKQRFALFERGVE